MLVELTGPIPERGRLLFFADLRSDLREGEFDRGVAGVVVHEYETFVKTFLPDPEGYLVLPGGRRVRDAELARVDPSKLELDAGEPCLRYAILELDARGLVVDDRDGFEDLEQARAFLHSYPDAAWEDLPPHRVEAAAVVQRRLAAPQA